MPYSGIKSIAKNAAYIFSGRFITVVFRAFYAVLLAKYLGPELYGLFNYGLSWYMALLPVTALGAGAYLAKHVGRDKSAQHQTLSTTLTLRIGLVAIVAGASALTGWLTEPNLTGRLILLIASFALIGRSLSLWANSVFISHERSRHILHADLIFRTGEVAIGAALLIMGIGIIEIALLHAISWLLQGGMSSYWVHTKIWRLRLTSDRNAITATLLLLIPPGSVVVLNSWFQQGPIVLGRILLDNLNLLGQVALAMQIYFVLAGLIWSIGQAALPVLSRSALRQDGKDVFYINTMFKLGTLLTTVSYILLKQFAPTLLPTIIGNDYTLAASLAADISLLLIPLTWITVTWNVLYARNIVRPIILAYILGALTLSALMYQLIPDRQLPGLVSAVLLGGFAWGAYGIIATKRYLKLKLWRAVAAPLIAGVLVIAIPNYLLSATGPAFDWLASLALIPVLYIGLGVFRPAEIRHLWRPVK